MAVTPTAMALVRFRENMRCPFVVRRGVPQLFPPPRPHGITVNAHRCRVLAVVPDYRLTVDWLWPITRGDQAVQVVIEINGTAADVVISNVHSGQRRAWPTASR